MPEIDLAAFIYRLSYSIIPLIFAITVHEVAHGWVAKQCGDPTAAFAGRLTLNPIKHIDPIGTVVLPIAMLMLSGGMMMFGWAKPVPVAFNNLDNPKRDMILVAVAGPGVNLLMALIWAIFRNFQAHLFLSTGVGSEWLLEMAAVGVVFNVLLAVFNMLPIPPLDGGRVLAGLVPPPISDILDRIEPFGFIIVLVLLYMQVLWAVIEPPYVYLLNIFVQIMALGLP